jgi:hypothetical protein
MNSIEITKLPNSLIELGAQTASSISITELPAKIKVLPDGCFDRCIYLRIDTFGSQEGDGLTTIGRNCFN